MVLRQHEATQLRSEMAVDPRRQRRHDRPALGRDPALAPEADGDRLQHQILDQVALVTLEARTGRCLGAQHPILDRNPPALTTATPALAPAGRRLGLARLLHPARLDRRRTLQPLQPGDLPTLLRHHLLQRRHLAQKREHQRLQIGCGKIIKIGGRRHDATESENAPARNPLQAQRVNMTRPALCHYYSK